MKIIHLILVVLLMSLVLGACSPKPADNLLKAVQQRGKLVVGTSADYPPYEFKDDKGNFVGYDMDLITEVAKRMGVKVEIQDLGFDALITAVQGRKVDAAIAAMASTPERLEKVAFSISYNAQAQAIMVRKDSTIVITEPKDMAKYSIGVQSGTTLADWLTVNLVEAGLMKADKISQYERAEQIALDLQAGRLEIGFVDIGPAQDLIANMDVKIAFSDFIAETGQAVAIPQGEPEFQAEIDRIIQELIDEGFIKKLNDTYIKE
jgi:polar amino acid transport system substrate-binding protein